MAAQRTREVHSHRAQGHDQRCWFSPSVLRYSVGFCRRDGEDLGLGFGGIGEDVEEHTKAVSDCQFDSAGKVLAECFVYCCRVVMWLKHWI